MATSPFFARSLRPSISTSPSSFICKTCRRNEATYRRTRKALRVKADPSFAPSATEQQDHIIFNPPSSAPNVYHTPAKFLPKSDPRRKLHTIAATAAATAAQAPSAPQGVLAAIAASRSKTAASALKPVRPIYEKKYHLETSQIEEIRALRKEDPRQWTRRRLAEKFDCSEFFVGLICSAPEIASETGMKQIKEAEHEAIRARYGRKKKDSREARVERRKLWGRDA